MLKSMTGFGRAEQTVGDKTFLIDIKSLNGKQFDLQLKMPAFLKPFEFDIRKILSEKLGRGTVDCTINLKETGNAKPVTINTDLAKAYYKPLEALAKDLGLDTEGILSTIIKLPEVITPTSDTLTPAEWEAFTAMVDEAIKNLNYHRSEEGKSLKNELKLRIDNILKQQDQVEKLEPLRQVKIREGLTKMLEEHVGKENYDT
ncbi:MAG TPA: YicC/YloC family endoribonuclease, partial [Flavisolibacter sp.]|nr:YicC/YloC family endoribonuclease [Flavisolibacter sp.]